MNFFELLIRLIISGALFVFFVFIWAGTPYLDPKADLNLTLVSFLYGNNVPTGIVRDLLLASRALLGMMLVSYVFVPSLRFFVDFQAEDAAKVISILFGLASIVAFFASLIVLQFFHL